MSNKNRKKKGGFGSTFKDILSEYVEIVPEEPVDEIEMTGSSPARSAADESDDVVRELQQQLGQTTKTSQAGSNNEPALVVTSVGDSDLYEQIRATVFSDTNSAVVKLTTMADTLSAHSEKPVQAALSVLGAQGVSKTGILEAIDGHRTSLAAQKREFETVTVPSTEAQGKKIESKAQVASDRAKELREEASRLLKQAEDTEKESAAYTQEHEDHMTAVQQLKANFNSAYHAVEQELDDIAQLLEEANGETTT